MKKDRTVLSAVVMYTLIIVSALIPAPYLIEMPGPVYNTLGDADGQPVMEITGAKTYESDGQLDMLTVGVAGGPGRPLLASQLLWSVARSHETVIPTEVYYPLDTTRESISEQNAAQMSSSQDTAVAAALGHLDMEYTVSLGVASVSAGAPVEGVLETGDLIEAVDGTQISGDEEGITALQDAVAGGGEVELTIRRSGDAKTVTVTPRDDGDGPKLGISLGQKYEFPIEVSFNVEDVGGPSAGLIFALTVIDTLTEGDMTGGVAVAGTGTIDPAGTVGPIGGARQKVYAADEAGNEVFLSPAGNCSEVLEAASDTDMQVVRVDSLDGAVDSLESIARGERESLPSCDAQAVS